MAYNYDAYEDGSSCDEDDINNHADAEAEYRAEQVWKLTQLVKNHLNYHLSHHNTPYSSWEGEDVLLDLDYKLNQIGCSLDDDERLEEIQNVINELIMEE